MGIKIPCTRECQDRSATCHATCEKYAAYVEANKAEAQRRLIKAQGIPRIHHKRYKPNEK